MRSYTYKRPYGAALLGLVGLVVGFYAPHVFAATQVNAFPVGTEAQIANIVTWIITGLNALLWIIFIFLSYLLDPNFIFNFDANGNSAFMDMLNQIWQLSRDLMNVAFALILVAAAIYTIVTANKEFISSHYKKFVMAVILVNFSWFFPQVILDVANVTAATIYGIPSLLADQNNSLQCVVILEKPNGPIGGSNGCNPITNSDGTPGGYKCPCKRILDAQWFVSDQFIKDNNAIQVGSDTPILTSQYWLCFDQVLCLEYGTLDLKTIAGHSAILNGLIVNQARLGDLVRIPPPIKANSDVEQTIVFIVRQIIILAIHIALFFPMAALLLAFAIRIPVLWLTMAFMPFLFLSFVADQQFITEYPKKLWENFLKAAFLPAMVAVPLTVGFIMVNAGSQLDGQFPWDRLQIPLLAQIGSFSELMWLLLSIGVLWVGVFAVLEKAGIMALGSQAIKRTGESLGRLALKAPLAMPIIPGPGGGTSPLFLLKALNPRAIEHGISGRQGIKGYLDDLKTPGASPGKGLSNDDAAEKLANDKDSLQKLENLHTDLERLRQALADGKSDAEVQGIMKEIKNKHGLDVDTNNFKKDMDEVIASLKKHNADAGKTTKIETKSKEIEAELQKRKPPTPTPPTPTPPTPTPPTPPKP